MSLRPFFLAVPVVLATAAISWASPAAALDSGADDPFELAQATPPASPPPAAGPERRGDRPAFHPKAVCLDGVARRAGLRTYLKIRLDLKSEQMTAWNAFAKAADDADAKETTRCNALPAEIKDRPGFMDRWTMMENGMKARVERMEAVKPTLVALYDVLTPEQKAVLDRPRMGGGREHHHWQR
jgi:hypothetical protein